MYTNHHILLFVLVITTSYISFPILPVLLLVLLLAAALQSQSVELFTSTSQGYRAIVARRRSTQPANHAEFER